MIALILLLSAQHVFAHGTIDKFECKSHDKKTVLVGLPNSDGKSFHFVMTTEGKKSWEADGTLTAQTDELRGDQVYEHLLLKIKWHGEFEIVVLETPQELRHGSGGFKGRKTAHDRPSFDCGVTY